jgi:hypothetical protein
VELEWKQWKFKHPILLDPSTNVALFHTAPAFEKFEACCTIIESQTDAMKPPPIAFTLHPVTDDEASEGMEEENNEPLEDNEASLTKHPRQQQTPL